MGSQVFAETWPSLTFSSVMWRSIDHLILHLANIRRQVSVTDSVDWVFQASVVLYSLAFGDFDGRVTFKTDLVVLGCCIL